MPCHYSTRNKPQGWSLTAFAFMLNTIKTNSKKILKYNKIMNAFDFTYQLGKVQQRLENSNSLKIPVLQNVRRVLGLPRVNRRLLRDLTRAVSGCCQLSAKKHTKKIVKNWKTNWNQSVVFFRVSFVKSTKYKLKFTCKNCFEKWYFSFSMSMSKSYDVYFSFYTYLKIEHKVTTNLG